jgi:hypothetical protein
VSGGDGKCGCDECDCSDREGRGQARSWEVWEGHSVQVWETAMRRMTGHCNDLEGDGGWSVGGDSQGQQ